MLQKNVKLAAAITVNATVTAINISSRSKMITLQFSTVAGYTILSFPVISVRLDRSPHSCTF